MVIVSFTVAAIAVLALLVVLFQYFSLKSKLEGKYFGAEAELRGVQASFDSQLKLQMNDWTRRREVEIRRDAIDRSKAVIVGKVTEHVVPYFPQFKFNPKDARFIGSPLDFVIFDGLDEGCLRKIVLVEVKTGAANLNTRERSIQQTVLEKRVEFAVLRIQRSAVQWESGP
jgi:predicted Holliday junction resolvase-like endonuclease